MKMTKGKIEESERSIAQIPLPDSLDDPTTVLPKVSVTETVQLKLENPNFHEITELQGAGWKITSDSKVNGNRVVIMEKTTAA